MTTETAPNIDQLKDDLASANTALSEANAAVAKIATEYITSGSFDKLAATPEMRGVQTAQTKVHTAQRALDTATKESRWASFEVQRAPVQAILADMVKARPMAPVTSAKLRITIDTEEVAEGDAMVQVRVANVRLTPVVDKIDLDNFEAMIAEAIDVAAWDAAGISDVSGLITRIGQKEFKASDDIRISPTASLNAAGKSATGERAGSREYNYNGSWLGTRDFIAAVEASGHAVVTDRARAFDVALRDPSERTTHGADGVEPAKGNGMSSFGKQLAKTLGVDTRSKATDK